MPDPTLRERLEEAEQRGPVAGGLGALESVDPGAPQKVAELAEARRRRMVEAGKIMDRDRGEKFVPTSEAERELAAQQHQDFMAKQGRNATFVDPSTGVFMEGIEAARRQMQFNEVRRMLQFRDRTGLDPRAPENRQAPRDEARRIAEEARDEAKKFRRNFRDPFSVGPEPSRAGGVSVAPRKESSLQGPSSRPFADPGAVGRMRVTGQPFQTTRTT
jgi:hypothetical protein